MKLGRFLTTLGIGALAGMLLAPKKGSELREELKGKGKETLDSAKEMTVEDYQKLISETIDSIKKTVDKFDVDDFKDSSLAKLNELKEELEKKYNVNIKVIAKDLTLPESPMEIYNEIKCRFTMVDRLLNENEFFN